MSSFQNRAFERRRCYLNARFVFNNGRCSLDSVPQQRFRPPGRWRASVDMRDVPESFDLVVSSSGALAGKRRARRVWTSGDAMGVVIL